MIFRSNPASDVELRELRHEIERLREFVETRIRTQERLSSALLAESVARAAEAMEGRIRLASQEAMAFAEQGLEHHEAALRAIARRVAEFGASPPAADKALETPASAGAFALGIEGAEAHGCRRIEIRDSSEEAFLADLANLPILPGGAARLVAAHVVEHAPAEAFANRILPHWRSRLAPDGELVIVTLDGPAFAADLSRLEFAALNARLGADGNGRPLRRLFDAQTLAQALTEAGLPPQPPVATPPFQLKIVAKAPAT